MQTIYFITSNAGKVESLKNILKQAHVPLSIVMHEADYPEDKSKETTNDIALQGATYCAKKYDKPVLVTDVGLYIESLNGFPGINTSFTLKRIGTQGLLKLLEGSKNRRANWILSLAYAEPDGFTKLFTETIHGTISPEEKGTNGFGFDPIFIPAGFSQTLAEEEASDFRDQVSPFKQAVLEFAEWYAQEHTPS